MNKKRIAILSVVVVLVCLLAFGIWQVMNRPEPEGPRPEPSITEVVASTGEDAETGEKAETSDVTETGDKPATEAVTETEDKTSTEHGTQTGGPSTDGQVHPKAPELTWIQNLDIPEYSGAAFISLNDGMPFFNTSELTPESYEVYYDLDELGRCTLADAVVGKDLMPTEHRGSISSVKPTGWHSSMYPQELVDGQSLYNRCHLIAFGLTGELANPYNLITGTRYFNTKGINDFENMVIDYIRETGNHVRYRVTPVWTGNNLVCDGQVVEAWSIEDEGEAICFCVYSYNVQPGICIDYLTGDNWQDGEEKPATIVTEEPELPLLTEDYEGTFILNTKKKKFHAETCEGASAISEKNKQVYTGSYNDLVREGYTPDAACLGE